MATTTPADQQSSVAEEVQLKNIISSSTTNTSMETKESSSGAAKEASAPKDATKDTKMHSNTGQESAKGDGKNKEKSKSPAKDLPAASSGSSPEKQVAKSATGADIKTNDKNAKPASPEKSKAAPEFNDSEASKATGIVQTTVDAVKNFVEKVVDKVQDAYSHTLNPDTVTGESKDDEKKKADQKETSPDKGTEKKEEKSLNKMDEKSKKSLSPTDKKKATAEISTEKTASPSKDQPAKSGMDGDETNSKHAETTDAPQEITFNQAAEKTQSSSEETKAKVGRGRRGSSGPRKAKEEVQTPPESLRRSTRLSKTVDSDSKNGAKTTVSGNKREASPTDTKAAKKVTTAAAAAASNGSVGKNSRRK